ncbi:MAG: FHA domain-containing protein [Prevotellaceae bacterium]|jgi:Zn-finger nucleic acid-binding protein|nr:FHA domain-containing protein [Prevotellaceae bacterium]
MKTLCQCPSCNAELIFDNSTDRLIKCPKCSYQGQTADFKEIAVKKLYCPNCDADFTIKLNKAPKTITCPKCKRTEITGKYSDKPKGRETNNMPGETTITNTQTTIGPDKLYKPVKLILAKDEGCWTDRNLITVDLKRGKNTLGRKSPNSPASIQLSTTDSYMSKNHAIIEVFMKADASFEHRFSDNHSKNGTFCNELKLEPGEVIILSPGDTIRLGRTSFKVITD